MTGERIALKPREAAELLGVSEPTIYRFMREGTVPFWQPSPRIRLIPRRALEELVERDAVHVVSEAV